MLGLITVSIWSLITVNDQRNKKNQLFPLIEHFTGKITPADEKIVSVEINVRCWG